MASANSRNMQPRYLKLHELTVYAGLSVRTLRNLAKRTHDPLPVLRIGAKILRVDREAFDEWFARQQQVTSQDLNGMVKQIMSDLTRCKAKRG